MKIRLLAVALPAALATACSEPKAPAPGPAPSLSASVVPAASSSTPPAAPKLAYAELGRDEVNRAAVRLDLPLYWVRDTNGNGAVDPDEVRTLLFYPSAPAWTEGGAFTEDFVAAYRAMVASERARDEKDPLTRELDGAAGALVLSDFRGASGPDRALVLRMLHLATLVDRLYDKQSGATAVRSEIPQDPKAQSAFRRNRGLGCVTPAGEKDPACSVIPGKKRAPVDVYPASLQTDPAFCKTLEQHPDAKKLLSPFVVVREDAKKKLQAVSYTVAYEPEMKAIADELDRTVKELDPAESKLAAYLTAAAKSFRTNDWLPADEAWAKMNAQNSRFYVRIAPDETYWEPCSHKAGFHLTFARINKESLAWQAKLAPTQQAMEDALAGLIGAPYKARKVTFHLPDFIDIVLNSGDDRDGVGATVGQSLPNWGPVANEGRGRTVAMSNLYTDPDSMAVWRAKAASLFVKESFEKYPTDAGGSLLSTILHEATHNLGPAHEYKVGGRKDSDVFGGGLASMLEELKAQSGALYFVDFGRKKGFLDAELGDRSYLESIVWGMNHVSRGMWTESKQRKPYSQLAAIQLGILLEEGALVFEPDATAANGKDKGAFRLDLAKMPAAAEKIMKTIGEIKAQGDKKRAEELSDRYVDGKIVPHALIVERGTRFPAPSFVYAVDL